MTVNVVTGFDEAEISDFWSVSLDNFFDLLVWYWLRWAKWWRTGKILASHIHMEVHLLNQGKYMSYIMSSSRSPSAVLSFGSLRRNNSDKHSMSISGYLHRQIINNILSIRRLNRSFFWSISILSKYISQWLLFVFFLITLVSKPYFSFMISSCSLSERFFNHRLSHLLLFGLASCIASPTYPPSEFIAY